MGMVQPESEEREAMGFDDISGVSARRAQLRCGVALASTEEDGERRLASKGDYVLTRMSDDQVGFRALSGTGVFTLSVDAVAQHVLEGRMTLDGALPRKVR